MNDKNNDIGFLAVWSGDRFYDSGNVVHGITHGTTYKSSETEIRQFIIDATQNMEIVTVKYEKDDDIERICFSGIIYGNLYHNIITYTIWSSTTNDGVTAPAYGDANSFCRAIFASRAFVKYARNRAQKNRVVVSY